MQGGALAHPCPILATPMGQTIASQISNQNTSVTLDDMFPIRTEEELEIFEDKIKGDKIFRNSTVILHIFFNIYLLFNES